MKRSTSIQRHIANFSSSKVRSSKIGTWAIKPANSTCVYLPVTSHKQSPWECKNSEPSESPCKQTDIFQHLRKCYISLTLCWTLNESEWTKAGGIPFKAYFVLVAAKGLCLPAPLQHLFMSCCLREQLWVVGDICYLCPKTEQIQPLVTQCKKFLQHYYHSRVISCFTVGT